MTIEWVEIEKLIPNPKNPYRHSEKDIEDLAKKIKFQGWRHPIITDETYLIWAGHKRLYAAKKIGLRKVPIHVQSFESYDQAYSFMTSDNETGKCSEIDLEMVNLELQNLGPDFDLMMLGIPDFYLEPAEKYEDVAQIPATKKCPTCGKKMSIKGTELGNG